MLGVEREVAVLDVSCAGYRVPRLIDGEAVEARARRGTQHREYDQPQQQRGDEPATTIGRGGFHAAIHGKAANEGTPDQPRGASVPAMKAPSITGTPMMRPTIEPTPVIWYRIDHPTEVGLWVWVRSDVVDSLSVSVDGIATTYPPDQAEIEGLPPMTPVSPVITPTP